MLKKLMLIMLCSGSLHAAGSFEVSALYTPEATSYATTYDLIGTLLVTTIIPNMLKPYLEADAEKETRKDRICKYTLMGVQLSLGIYYIAKLCVALKGTYDYLYPSEAQKAAADVAAEALKMLQAKRLFRNCLMSNALAPRNDAGLPTACEGLSEAYRAVAGQSAFDELATNFKHAYNG